VFPLLQYSRLTSRSDVQKTGLNVYCCSQNSPHSEVSMPTDNFYAMSCGFRHDNGFQLFRMPPRMRNSRLIALDLGTIALWASRPWQPGSESVQGKAAVQLRVGGISPFFLSHRKLPIHRHLCFLHLDRELTMVWLRFYCIGDNVRENNKYGHIFFANFAPTHAPPCSSSPPSSPPASQSEPPLPSSSQPWCHRIRRPLHKRNPRPPQVLR
jgi:hypothetical protein